jgi:hypothetical protein
MDNLVTVNLMLKPAYNTEKAEAAKWAAKNNLSNQNSAFNLKTGDIIQFKGGYNRDIAFTSEIIGFNKNGDAFVVWDCYWFNLNLSERLLESVDKIK